MKVLVTLLFTIFNLNIVLCKINEQIEQAAKNSELCSQIGIEENAVLNSCGFCTEGETGLDSNYGFDCNHICNGESVLDCNNQCNGNSFIDVCTGICITPTENQTVYENRDCSGICLNSEFNTNEYAKNECGQCVLKCTDDQNGNSVCGLQEVNQICGQTLKNSEQKSLNLQNQCNGCQSNYTIDCSFDSDPDLCGCINSSRDCYYMTSINPNVVPNNTPIDINITGYFNGTAKNTYCYLTHERDGTELAFIAKNISQSIIECNINLTKVGQYLFSLQKNYSKNTFKLSVYDNELAFYSYMSPKQVLTTDFKKPIDLMFEIKRQINFNFKAILKCKLIYLNNNWKQTVIIGNNGNSCTIPESDSHSQSQEIVVIPTFDGIHSVSDPYNFTLTIMSPFPRVVVEQSFISEDGLNILIVFERSVHIYVPKTMFEQQVCDHYFTNSTLNRLKTFGLIVCKWLSRTQFLISVKNPIDINFIELSINENTIREYRQTIYQTNDRIDLIVKKNKLKQYYQDYPQLELRGPTIIPLCGAFSLSADFYSPKGSKNVVFKWSVITLPFRQDLISDQLLKTIDSNNKTNVLLFGQMFALDSISYKFTISAHLEDKTVVESSVQLFRVTDQLPIVTVFGTIQPNPNQLISPKRQTLYSEVSIPKCIKRPQHLRYQWKTNNPKIRFNFQNMSSADYQIDSKYSFERTIYEINVYSGNDSSMMSSTASFNLLPTSEDSIIDMSNRTSIISIGERTGKFKIAAKLIDPNKSNQIGFIWSCHYSHTLVPCSLKSDPNKLLITRDIQNRREMSLNSEVMRIGEHVFGLDVIDSVMNVSQHFSLFTTVQITSGKAPKIYIESVSVEFNDKRIELSLNYNSNVITVPSNTHLVIKGVIQKLIQIDSIEWQLSESFIQLGWTNKLTRDGIISELHLYPDQISGYGSYNISLKACNGKDICSQVNSQLIGEPVVNQCVLTMEQTNNTEQIAFITNRCNVPMSRLPLTYQLYEANDDNQMMIPKTRPHFSPIIVIDYSSQLISNGKTYSVEVCDGYGFCQMINTTNTALVSTDYQNNSQTFDDLIDRSQRYSSIDPISALSQLKISQMTNISDISDENFINDLKVEYLLQLKPNHIRHRGDLTLVYHTFGEVFGETKDFQTKYNLIKTMKTISEKSTDKQTLDYFYTNVLNFYNNFENRVYHKINESYGYFKEINENKINSYLKDIRHILSNILICCAKQIEIGQFVNLGTGLEFPKAITVMTHQKKFNELKLITKLNESRNVSAFVRFQEKANKYYRRITQNIQYNSVVYSVTLFPDESPYTLDSEMHKLSPIVDITVHLPNSGQRLDKEFILNTDDKTTFFALMKVTLTGNKTYGSTDYATKCFNFNESKNSWEMNGVTISGISGSNGGCFITQLSTVIMVRVVQHISTDYIFGVLVAVLMGVLIFGIMVVFFVQKKEQTLNVKSVHRNNYTNSYSDDSYKNNFDYNYY